MHECQEPLSGCCGAPEGEGTGDGTIGICTGCGDWASFECPICEFGEDKEVEGGHEVCNTVGCSIARVNERKEG